MYNILDYDALAENILKFENCVRAHDLQLGFCTSSSSISFNIYGSWLYKQEHYKQEIYEKTIEAMDCESWHKSTIGSGSIAKNVQKAFKCTNNNLINSYQKISFNNHFDNQPDYYLLDKTFYNLYRGNDDMKAFDELISIFGKKYDLIAFLFFIKNPNRYLPVRSSIFEEGLGKLGIDYKMHRRCSWNNYIGYVKIIKDIQKALNDLLPLESSASLLDAHSFVWIVEHDFYKWVPNQEAANKISQKKQATIDYLKDGFASYGSENPEYRDKKASYYTRNAKVANFAREQAKGVCQLCGKTAPFKDKNGNPYLEIHHIEWLSRHGADNIFNVVALCPNCHSKMHILDDPDDVEYLKKRYHIDKQGSPIEQPLNQALRPDPLV